MCLFLFFYCMMSIKSTVFVATITFGVQCPGHLAYMHLFIPFNSHSSLARNILSSPFYKRENEGSVPCWESLSQEGARTKIQTSRAGLISNPVFPHLRLAPPAAFEAAFQGRGIDMGRAFRCWRLQQAWILGPYGCVLGVWRICSWGNPEQVKGISVADR